MKFYKYIFRLVGLVFPALIVIPGIISNANGSFLEYIHANELIQAATPGETNLAPILTATPGPDGKIVHTVEYGQSLYSIAVAYGQTIDQIKSLNGLTTNDIYVGDKLLIKMGDTPTVTQLPTSTQTRTPRPTRTATIQPATARPTRTNTSFPTIQDLQQNKPGTGLSSSIFRQIDPILVFIIGIGIAGLVLMLLGGFLKRSK